ncbi:reverse transcriptase domain-containing protein [Tanacetum coccineum]
MEEMLNKFIEEGKQEHEEMRSFIYDFQTNNELLFKERNNSLIELRFRVQELLNVINNIPMIDCDVKGVTTRGGKTTTQDVHDNDTNVLPKEPVVVEPEKPVGSNEVLTNDQPQITCQPVVQPSNEVQPPPVPFPRRLFVTNKARLEEACKIIMNKRCSVVLLNKLPSKEKDPESFTIPCDIGQLHIDNALADLGASISLMPYTMYKKLGLGEPKATRMSLELADRSIKATIEERELLANEEPDLFLSRGLEKSIDQSDLECCDFESTSSNEKNGADSENSIRRDQTLQYTYTVARTNKWRMIVKSDTFIQPCYRFDEKKLRFFQIPITPEDQEKTTFTCPYGTFAYRRMPFGLCNAPATFQRCMTTTFHDMVEDFMEVFMDDFLVFGNSFDCSLANFDRMLARPEISINDEPWRCVVGNEILEILGHCHYGPTRGHHSASITGRKVYESGFYWPSIFKDTKDYVMRCDACQRSGNISSRSEMLQNNIQICDVFDIWGLDFMGPSKPQNGIKLILVAVVLRLKMAKGAHSEDQYAVSIKEDTAYLCLHSPKTTDDEAQYAVSRETQYAIFNIWNEYNILEDIKRDPYSKKSPIRRIQLLGYAEELEANVALANNLLDALTQYLEQMRSRGLERLGWSRCQLIPLSATVCIFCKGRLETI